MNDLRAVRKRKAAAVAAAAAMGSTAVAAMGAPGAEASSPSSCPAHYFCEWSDSGFNGPIRTWNTSDSNYQGNHYNNGPSSLTLNDTVSAVYNNTSSHWVKMFNNADGSGYNICIAPGGAESFLGNVIKNPGIPTTYHNNWNDSASSHYLYTYQPSGCQHVITEKGCSM